MRTIASILLLFILLFNTIGYRAWFYYAEKQSDLAMEARLDKDQYSDKDLVSISIQLDNPYQLEQKSFQKAEGEISYQGNIFKIVKRKITDGTLTLLCISDAHKVVLKKAKSEFGNSVNDLAGNGKNSHSSQKNFGGNDYISHISSLNLGSRTNAVPAQNGLYKQTLPFTIIDLIAQPPRTLA